MYSTAFTFLALLFFPGAFLPVSGPAPRAAIGKCAIPRFEQAYERASAVFVGKVATEKSEGQLKIFEFEVEKYWKGADEDRLTVYVNQSLRFEPQFEIGKSYLVFAETEEDDPDGRLFDHRCSRTKPFENGYSELKEDLRKLGPAKFKEDRR